MGDRGLGSMGSPGRLKAQLRHAGVPLRTLEFPGSDRDDRTNATLDAWVLLDSDEVTPDAEPLVIDLWGSLRVLADEVDPESRVSLSRWMLKAAETVDLFRLLRERGPPPTSPLQQPRRPDPNQAPPAGSGRPLSAR